MNCQMWNRYPCYGLHETRSLVRSETRSRARDYKYLFQDPLFRKHRPLIERYSVLVSVISCTSSRCKAHRSSAHAGRCASETGRRVGNARLVSAPLGRKSYEWAGSPFTFKFTMENSRNEQHGVSKLWCSRNTQRSIAQYRNAIRLWCKLIKQQ